MSEDIRVTLKQKGYQLQADGSYTKVAAVDARLPDAKRQPNPLPALDQGPRDEAPVLARTRVRITRRSTGQLDEDNLHSSVKSLLDGLRQAGIISDDSPKVIDLKVAQERVATRKEQGTLVEIFDPEK